MHVEGLNPHRSTATRGRWGDPHTSSLKEFSSETTFMSLPGYLRYLVHELNGEWPTYAEAAGGRVATQQSR